MADYFGRTMVAALPSEVKIGVVDVAIGGVSIDGFMSDLVADYINNLPASASYMLPAFAAYGNDPYQRHDPLHRLRLSYHGQTLCLRSTARDGKRH